MSFESPQRTTNAFSGSDHRRRWWFIEDCVHSIGRVPIGALKREIYKADDARGLRPVAIDPCDTEWRRRRGVRKCRSVGRLRAAARRPVSAG